MKKVLSLFMALTILLSLSTGLTFGANAKTKQPTYDNFYYKILTDGTVEITGSSCRKKDNVIPSHIDGRAVTSLANAGYSYEPASLTIPETVTNIEKDAFNDFSTLSNITVSENNPYFASVDGVLYNKDKTQLIRYPIAKEGTSYTVLDTTVHIGDLAFMSCENLKEIYIPASVAHISTCILGKEQEWVFSSSVASIQVDTANSNYSSENGVLFTKDKTVLVSYPSGKTDTDYTIPASVTSIGNYAFISASKLQNVVIPENVKSIGEYAFYFCLDLKKITVSDKVGYVGESAFGNTANEYYSGSSEFTDQPALYYGGTALQWAKLIRDKTKYGGWGNYTLHCAKASKLDYMRISFVGNNKLAVYDYYGTAKNVVIPSEVDGCKITHIYGLGSNSPIKKLTIGSNVKSISVNALIGLTKLESITVAKANANYSSKSGVLFNKARTRLVAYPIAKTAKSYKIPDSVTAIGQYAFCKTKKLQTLALSAKVKNINADAFYRSTSLKSYKVNGKNKYYSAKDGVLFNKKKTALVAYPAAKSNKSYTVPKTVKTIKAAAFTDCKYLSTLKLPKSVKTIENTVARTAFENCKLKKVYYAGSKKDVAKIKQKNFNGKKTAYTTNTFKNGFCGAKVYYNAKI